MGLVRLLVVVMIAAAQAGCASTFVPDLVAAPAAPPPLADLVAAPAPPPPPADLDSIMYARGPAVIPAVPAALPLPEHVLPGPAPGGDLPYTLDSGDRLRIVVFGQDGLSNTYIVDVSGKITMPLIGAVPARGCTTTQLARAIADRLRNGYVRDPHVAS